MKNSNKKPPREVIQTLKNKPYAFVPLPDEFEALEPVWHDGSSSQGRLSGEVRFEMTTLTPLLVGWERKTLKELGLTLNDVPPDKPTLSPLRAPWGHRPVLIPGDSLKGLLRHELGALMGAPMERVAERSYSYRPNAMFAQGFLRARLARVIEGQVESRPIPGDASHTARVPLKLELLSDKLRYDKWHEHRPPYYEFMNGSSPRNYRGGQGAGQMLNSKKELHSTILFDPSHPGTIVAVGPEAIAGYLHTIRHLTDLSSGHFSERHPDVPEQISGATACARILDAAGNEVFQPGDLIWVEWDTEKGRIVSFGWHYYYRWAYQDTVRLRGSKEKRKGLFPTEDELKRVDPTIPEKLTLVRRLFGYTGDNDGSKDIGRGHHSQLMGRISINAAIEDVRENEKEDDRFIKQTFLRELGLPKPSAVEHYIQQRDDHVRTHRKDDAMLMTYGDAKGYDKSGELAGRKFYLDRAGATAEDISHANKSNKRSTLAIDASKKDRRFRFTLRFRDLDKRELVAVLLALCPEQFKSIQTSNHTTYCSKLGYARPLGWGSVQIQAKEMYFLEGDPLTLQEQEPARWFREHQGLLAVKALGRWFKIHQCNHPEAGDYPTLTKNGPVYEYHSELRAQHSRRRRFRREGQT